MDHEGIPDGLIGEYVPIVEGFYRSVPKPLFIIVPTLNPEGVPCLFCDATWRVSLRATIMGLYKLYRFI